jgi:HNH endonuclease
MAFFRRNEVPPDYTNDQKYRPFLRRDFLARCAYCERTEEYMGGEEAFEVEHFRPRSKFPDLICVYSNLYYVCRKCNGHKWETWPSDDLIARGVCFADPCEKDPYVHHLREREDGRLDGITPCGVYSNRHIRLDRNELQRWRRLRAEARRDLPRLTGVAQLLDQLISVADAEQPERAETMERLAAIRRRIEESKLRFSIG